MENRYFSNPVFEQLETSELPLERVSGKKMLRHEYGKLKPIWISR